VVNGTKTIVPRGTTGAQFDAAMDRLTDADLTAMSVTGKPPIDTRGRPLMAHNIAIEGKFAHMGADVYAIRLADGKFALSGLGNENNTPVRYLMRIDTGKIAELAMRKDKQIERLPGTLEPSDLIQ